MAELITADKLITKAKSKKIDLGKGDPYNRLRYYTKIGWLPHMERKKDSGGNVVGHYPSWIVERLELIDELKGQGLSNDAITQKIEAENNKRNLSKALGFLKTPENRIQTAAYISLVLLVLILATETGAFSPTGTTKRDLINSTVVADNEFDQIIDSGTGAISENEKVVFVKTNKVNPRSKVHITFEDNYSPATKYWVEDKVSFEGFYLETDAAVAQDSIFNWWVTN